MMTIPNTRYAIFVMKPSFDTVTFEAFDAGVTVDDASDDKEGSDESEGNAGSPSLDVCDGFWSAPKLIVLFTIPPGGRGGSRSGMVSA